jgi:hypothetical protein
MGRYASETGSSSFKPAPAGSHVARAIAVVDIGTHHDEYQGKPNVRNQVIVRWELPNELEEFDGVKKPLIVSKFYTNSLNPKANLRHDLEAWRTKNFTTEELMKFDLMSILGKACTVSIVHTESGKAKVVSVSALPKGTSCPKQFNPSLAFWIDEWNEETFRSLPVGFQNLISDSDEYKAMWEGRDRSGPPAGATAAVGELADEEREIEDDIPF